MSDFQVHIHDAYTLVTLPKRIDVTNTQGLLNAVRSAMGRGNDRFILDLSGTEAIDSTALGAIVTLYKTLRVGEGDLCLLGVGEGVMRVLTLTRLNTVFSSFDSVESAAQSWQAAS